MRLIDADILVAKLKNHHDFFVDAYGGFSNLPVKDKARVDEITHCIAEIINSPTIEVVRCKDCKHCSTNTPDGLHWCSENEIGSLCDDDFCSHGERRKESEDDVEEEEVVHGRWIWTVAGEEDWEQYWRCSKCNDKSYTEYNYCPNCGAKMDGVKDNA